MIKKVLLLSLLCFINVQSFSEVKISDKNLGYWENVVPEYNNWWEVSSNKVINYGTANTNKCIKTEVKIISKDRLNVDFGNKAIAEIEVIESIMHLKINELSAKHKPISKADICKRDGLYFEGAPYKN